MQAELSPAELQSSALAAASAQQSVHYVSTLKSTPNLTRTIVADAGRTSGVQRITYAGKGGKEEGRGTVLVVDGELFIKGDHRMLALGWGLRVFRATKWVGKWISIPRSHELYDVRVSNVTLESAIADITLSGALTLAAPETIEGERALGINGTIYDCPGTLYVAEAAPHFPIAESFSEDNGLGARIVLSNWNEPVDLTAPAESTPIGETKLG